jgi:HAE1 family hydrophobic/amphiphilic exporter-1
VTVAEPLLPEEVKREGVTVKKKSTNIVLMVNLFSPDGQYDEIYQSNYINTQIKDVLSRVPGVGEVMVFGAKDFGMRVWLDPELLKSRKLTTNDVVEAIREQNVQVAAGQIGAPPSPAGQEFQYTVNAMGRLSDVEQFENIILKVGANAEIVRVRDVARVELGAQSYNWYVQLNGKPSIAMGIYQLPGANALDVAAGIRSEMNRLAERFPEGLQYTIAYDTTRFITASIREVIITLFVAIVLVILTVYVFLQDLRTTLIPAVTIPVSLLGTFSVMAVMGLSINTLSLFGLVLAIGIVVDDAIVVVENTMRIMDEEGLERREATVKAMQQITGPVIATTLVLLAVFVPTAMLGGITGRLYQQFALTIATATVFSSINALTMSPALCGLLLRPTPESRGFFFNGFNRLFDASTKGYMAIVNVLVRRTALAMVPFAAIVALMAFGFRIVPAGFIPDEDQGYIMVSGQLPDGATLERTAEVVDDINEILGTTPGVSDTISIGGYSILDSVITTNAAAGFVTLDPWGERKEPQLQVSGILQSVQGRLAGIQEAIVFGLNPPPIQGLGAAGGFEYQLEDRGGAGIAQLQAIGQDVVFEGSADPVLTRMNSSLRASVPQLYLDVDRVKAKTLGVPLSAIFQTLQAYLGSAYVNDFNLFGRTYKVMIQADQQYRSRVEDVNRLEVRDRDGNMVPLSTLVTISDAAGPQTISRYNLYPSSTITGQPNPGYSSGQAIGAMEDLSERLLPQSMGYEWSGVTYQQIKAGSQAPFIFGLAIVFVFLFLAAQYESWSLPLAVILSVPLALLGGIFATWARAYDNNVYTQIGVVLLIGLAAKGAILIVEFAKEQRAAGKSIIEAATSAAHLRFRALLMTAFSFILGVVPLVIATGAGAGSRRALGTAVFGGMLASTALGVFFIPVLYVVVQRLAGHGRETEQTNHER